MQRIFKNAKTLFEGKRVDLLEITTQSSDGKELKREVVSHPGAVVILPLIAEDKIVLIRNERFAVQQSLWELPAGTLEKNEDPLKCAARELIEETGYSAASINPLFNFFSSPGFCNELLFAYLATNLNFVGQKLDEHEKIDIEITTLDHALKMIKEGIICDAKTICLLLYFSQYMRYS